MKFSLWQTNEEKGEQFIQSSDDQHKLRCSTNQLKMWANSMGVELGGLLTVRDNKANKPIWDAQYQPGAGVHWRKAAD